LTTVLPNIIKIGLGLNKL